MGKAISRPQRSLLIGSVLFVYFLKLIILDSVPIGTFLSMTSTLSEGSPCLSKNNGNFPSILYHMIISITGQKASLTADEPHIPTLVLVVSTNHFQVRCLDQWLVHQLSNSFSSSILLISIQRFVSMIHRLCSLRTPFQMLH